MRYGIVKVSTADLRRRPGHRSEMVSQGLLGAVLQIEGPSAGEGWLRVSLPDRYTGWMRSWNVAVLAKSKARRWTESATAMVVRASADVLASKRLDSQRLRDLVLGCRVIPIRNEGPWTRAALPDGLRGWVRTRALAVEEPRPARGAAIVRTARLFLGSPYLWGGVSPKGADCSGLVQTVFGVHGVRLPRDVADQRRCGTRVHTGGLRDGDLLFFGSSEAKLTHVGLSTGGLEFIHAGCPIEEASLDPNHRAYQPRVAPLFRFAMRIL